MSGAGPARVLLVDDEPVITRSLGRILTAAGYEVLTAHDGDEALARLGEAPFDAVVSDIRMPGLDGLALLRDLQERELEIPVILLTGSPTVRTAMEAVEHGAFRYLTKPVTAAELVGVVARAVQWRHLMQVRREIARELQGPPPADRAELTGRFDSALATLWMAMQPIVSWKSRAVFAYEALARSDEPTLRRPLDLFDAAERLGRTAELGRAIRKRIARTLEAAPPALLMFMNVHPVDLEDGDLLADGGVLTPFARQVVLEITERVSLTRVARLADRIARLRELGYRIAIDDLGARYAGLDSFAQLEPDVVKVDMSLVRSMDGSPTKQKFFRSVSALCADMGARLIAEGIETPAERDCASSLGGDLFQGYLFAKPAAGLPAPVY